jgi:carbonyl reductase 1
LYSPAAPRTEIFVQNSLMQLRLYTFVVLGLTAVASALASGQRVVLVTGANKGIGKEIARTLGFLPDHFVVLGCRDEALGNAVVAELRAAGCDCAFTRLDLLDVASIASTRDFIQDTFGRLDGLVNNAAICFNDPTLYGKVPHTPFQQQADITIRTNYHGTVAVTEAMLPLLRKSEASPRVVNVASAAGRLRGSQEIQDAFTAHDLDLPALTQLMEDFVRDVEAGVHAERGWPNTCYGVSKMGLIAYTRVLAQAEPGLMVNSVDPGFCATDQVGCCCGCCCCHARAWIDRACGLCVVPTAFSFLFVALLLVSYRRPLTTPFDSSPW